MKKPFFCLKKNEKKSERGSERGREGERQMASGATAAAAAAGASLRALRELGGQSAVLSAPASAPVASRNLEEARTRAKHLFREVSARDRCLVPACRAALRCMLRRAARLHVYPRNADGGDGRTHSLNLHLRTEALFAPSSGL